MTPEERASSLYHDCTCGANLDIDDHVSGCGYPTSKEIAEAIRTAEAEARRKALEDAAKLCDAEHAEYERQAACCVGGTHKNIRIYCEERALTAARCADAIRDLANKEKIA